MRVLCALIAGLVCAACVGDRSELGGVDNRVAPPAVTKACSLDELKVVRKGQFVFPGDAAMFMHVSRDDVAFRDMAVRYDITEQGVPANIAYVGNPADMKHATKQAIIRAIADAVADTRYQWLGAPAFATGCRYSMSVESG